MKHIWNDRRTYLATLAILILGTLAWFKGMDVSTALASVAVGIGAANAYEKRPERRDN